MENKRLFGKICYVHRQMLRENNKIPFKYGVTPVQLRTLVFVHVQSLNGVKVCQKDIENHLNLRPSSVSSLISNLENDGFLVRSTDEDNARKKHIELTEKGKEVYKEDKKMMDECDGIVQSALSEEEQSEFAVLLDKIVEKIERR